MDLDFYYLFAEVLAGEQADKCVGRVLETFNNRLSVFELT
jgi:hypothetical protein